MNLLINTYYTLSAKLFMLMADGDITVSDTGITDIDDPLNRMATIICKLAAVGGFVWLVISLVMFGFAYGDQSPHEKKNAMKSAIGAAIIMAAGAIALFVKGDA